MDNEQIVNIPFQCVFAMCGCMWWSVPKSRLKNLAPCLGCGLKLVEVKDNDYLKPENVRLIYSEKSNRESKRSSKGTQQSPSDANELSDGMSGHDPENNNRKFDIR
jgi:hypothetical protein